MLTTNNDAKLYLGIIGSGEEDLITLLVKLASGAISTFTGWAIETTAVDDDIIDGGERIIRLKGKNVVTTGFSFGYNSGTLSTPNWVTVSANEYALKGAQGIIEMVNPTGYAGLANLRLSYTCGYTTIPSEIEMICLALVGKLYNKRRAEGLVSEGMESVSVSYATNLLNNDEKKILSKYSIYPYIV